MAEAPLFFGLLLLIWLALGILGWLAVTLRYQPAASLLALGTALTAAIVAGLVPALLGWRSPVALLCGLVLALAGSAVATWQAMRIGVRRSARASTRMREDVNGENA